MKRVVITGQGAISSLGMSATATMEGMRDGRCGITDLEIQDVDRLSVKIGGQVKGYDGADYFSRQELVLYDKSKRRNLFTNS